MKRLCCGISLLLFAGCGSGGNVAAVTPVMADAKGSYRLAAGSDSISDPSGGSSFVNYSGGTLRLADASYTRTVIARGEQQTAGVYALGSSANTILNTSHGSFTLTSSAPPNVFTGSYGVTPDFTLTLNYDPFQLPGLGTVTRSETWVKVSDSPRF